MKEHTFTVYIHISPNNKVYVGITHLKPEYRWANGKGYEHNKYFYRAIQKYGWDNFEHRIIADHLTQEQAYYLEKLLIQYYNSTDSKYGYNSSTGGDKSALGARYKRGTFSDEHKKSLSDAWVKRKEKGLGDPWNKGMKLKHTGCLDNFIRAGKQNAEKQKRPIQMIDKQTGEVLQEFPGVIDAAKYLKKTYTSSIIDTALGKRKSAFGYYWKYIE